MKLICTILISFIAISSYGETLEFRLNNKTIIKYSNRSMKSGQLKFNDKEISSNEVTLFNAWRKYERTYKGYSLFELLDLVYGKKWRSAKKINFISQDGYRQIAKISEMLKVSQGKTGLVAYTEKDKNGFSKFMRGKVTIDPGPFYLVWTNFNKEDKAKHSDTLKWPYQLKLINIITK